jgi:hypothetical protein
MTYTEEILMAAWREVNNAGCGFAPAGYDMDIARSEYTEVYDLDGDAFCAIEGGRTIVVCDANGPWACDVTDIIEGV